MKYQDELKIIHDSGKCPFCTLDDNLIILEYESAIMLLARAPYHPDHLLVIPRRHIISYLRLDIEEYEEIQSLCRRGISMLKKLGYTDMTVLVREGMEAGKSIHHLHYHIIPHTMIGDVDHHGVERKFIDDAEIKIKTKQMKNIADKIEKYHLRNQKN